MDGESSLFASDLSLYEARKRPPNPTAQYAHVPVAPIMSNQFPPFSYFFICINKAMNLHNCSLQSLYMLIRTHPSLQPIMTPNAWCNDAEASFKVGYSLDFTNVPHFTLGDFTPVVELYIRYPKKSQLVGIAFLPLRVLEICNINDKPITYLFKDTSIDIKDVVSGRVVGNVVVTVALGEREHQAFLDPNAPKPIPEPPKPIQQAPPPPPPRQETRRSRRVYSDSDYYSSEEYSEEEEELDWVTEATRHGWIKPGSMGNWKEKALKKGWTPPVHKAFYTTGTDCDLLETAAKTETMIQVDLDLPDIMELHSAHDIDDVKEDIESMFSGSSQKSSMEISEQAVFSVDSGVRKKPRKMQLVKASTIFDGKPKDYSDDDEISDIHQSILKATGNFEEEEDDSSLNESMMKQVSEINSQNPVSRILSESDSEGEGDDNGKKLLSSSDDDFKPLNEEETESSELIMSGSRKLPPSSGNLLDASVPSDNNEEETSSAIFHSPVKSRPSSSVAKRDESDLDPPPAPIQYDEEESVNDEDDDEQYNQIMNDPMLQMLSLSENDEEEEDIPPHVTKKPIKIDSVDLGLDFDSDIDGSTMKLKYSGTHTKGSAPQLTLSSEGSKKKTGGITPLSKEDNDSLHYSMSGLDLDTDSDSDGSGVF